jgi:hypothetical protein
MKKSEREILFNAAPRFEQHNLVLKLLDHCDALELRNKQLEDAIKNYLKCPTVSLSSPAREELEKINFAFKEALGDGTTEEEK